MTNESQVRAMLEAIITEICEDYEKLALLEAQ
jgi:hypothetical protein